MDRLKGLSVVSRCVAWKMFVGGWNETEMRNPRVPRQHRRWGWERLRVVPCVKDTFNVMEIWNAFLYISYINFFFESRSRIRFLCILLHELLSFLFLHTRSTKSSRTRCGDWANLKSRWWRLFGWMKVEKDLSNSCDALETLGTRMNWIRGNWFLVFFFSLLLAFSVVDIVVGIVWENDK